MVLVKVRTSLKALNLKGNDTSILNGYLVRHIMEESQNKEISGL